MGNEDLGNLSMTCKFNSTKPLFKQFQEQRGVNPIRAHQMDFGSWNSKMSKEIMQKGNTQPIEGSTWLSLHLSCTHQLSSRKNTVTGDMMSP